MAIKYDYNSGCFVFKRFLLASGYDPKLGDGVGKNIAPLQKAGLLSYEVLNSGQLKKYLNADW